MNKTKKKFDCWNCEYRGEVAGSAHICCNHPSLKTKDDPMANLMGIFASVGRVPPVMENTKELKIKGNERGIAGGWFNFPFNFDPLWLENCDGFKKTKTK